ncbi:MAG: hypothetical protein ACREAA_08395 [Candidatus Polarisedimenticolia bacterium]
MNRVVFYSWQSDLPNRCNRGFIQTALEQTAAEITADNNVAVEPVVDRDTQNVPGSPDIASTIFTKIVAADVFVADVSITTRARGKRPTPNPNVLIELGYALKALGPERVILVFNRSFGKIEELPFDLRSRRVLTYEMPDVDAERSRERGTLKSQFKDALSTALSHLPPEPPRARDLAVHAVESLQPNRVVVVRRTLEGILQQLDRLEPPKPRDGGTADQLIDAIRKTQDVIADFSKLVEMVAIMDDLDAGIEVYRWFGKLFQRYDLPAGFTGSYNHGDHDFFKFVGHEMFVSFVAFLLREQRWDTLAKLLDEPIPMKYIPNHGPGSVEWDFASEHLALLADESQRRHRVSLHSDLLKERHSDEGGLAALLSLNDFAEADFFLFLMSLSLSDDTGLGLRYWRAWSCLYLRNAPVFVRHAERKRVAEPLMRLFKRSSIDDLRKFLTEHGPRIARLFGHHGLWGSPIPEKDIGRVGTR